MKQLLLSILVIFSIGFLQAGDKNVFTKKIVIVSDQNEKNVSVNVEVENDKLTLTIQKDGKENVYEVNLKDNEAFEALKEELENLNIDVDILALTGNHNDHQKMFFKDDRRHGFHFSSEGGGFLGVQIQDITDQLRDYFKMKGDGGVLVTEVVKDSPAEKAGLEAGDIITRVNNVRISNAGELTRTIRKETPETEVNIIVIRKGREKSLKATLGSSGDSFSWFGTMGDHHKNGMKKYKKMMKKFDHKCDDITSPGC
ncbi:MAG: PDZ domain-containing protein, partial [Candidatus Marinimicrobia bacterium]|nr:PDZ domain-containing protein [Candidatus Neomarinimicrobiota bacterium]